MAIKIIHVILLASVKYIFTLPYAMIIGLEYKQAIIAILPPLILRRLIDGNLAQSRIDGIFELALGYLGVTVAVHLTSFFTAYSTSVAA